MMKKPLKALSLMLVAAAVLILLFGVPTTISNGADDAIVIDTPSKWADLGTTITLENNKELFIYPAAGSPAFPTVIQIAANANVKINSFSQLIENLRIAEGADTAAHTVRLSNLTITASGGVGYLHNMGVIELIGDNLINGNGNIALYSAAPGSVLTITSSNGGTLIANGVDQTGIHAMELSIEGNADVSAETSGSAKDALVLDGPTLRLSVAENAKLTATGSEWRGIFFNITTIHSVECKGTIIASGKAYGIVSLGNMSITGSGTIIASGSTGISTNQMAVSETNIVANGTAQYGIYLATPTDIILSNSAKINATGANGAMMTFGAKGFTMSLGTTVTLKNSLAAWEVHPFTMGSSGNQWVLSGNASFGSSQTPESSPATIEISPSGRGTVVLASVPGIDGPTTMTLTEGYAAASSGVFTLTGTPTPTVTTTGDEKITWNADTKKLNIAAGLAAGSYEVVLKASNGATPDATVTFTLTVTEPVVNDSSGTSIWLWISIVVVIIIVVGYVLFNFVLKKKGV
ncbi:hypothetical protein Mpt1_c14400 [Candidatus Methanoplasma termitum]|uniref:Right handed beta helix domain-containing protein n=1 Tax=Candidatus Methanoplasma termitum TaxID=1577791 RepID=A0A0A7LIG0_9ARCH|nr:hypothetical protein [Candidatus Methanoplasma termitum]AIZ57296.1 hypothetical protein Mpt1_c14400 [Candidatus Methanoplasma termitum]